VQRQRSRARPPCNDPSLSLPIHQYAHSGPGCSGSITGGPVYRTIPRTECSDGIDNDDDTLVDHPDDPGCLADPARNRESTGCGGGGAAALILVPLTLATRRRLR
jgi:hypothetical protein